MNTWGYIFLIAALAMLAGFMVYVRLRMRAKEKSLHHTPVETHVSTLAEEKTPEVISSKEEDPVPAETALEGDSSTEEITSREVEVIATPVAERKSDSSKREETDYIDELQEAAAGLAALMRSSPVSRTQPVVFAPEEETVESEIEKAEDLVLEESAVEAESSVVEESGTPELEEEIVCEVPSEVDVIVEEESAVQESISDLFGEEISLQFELIDDGLNALEDLVVGLESSLARLEPVEDEWQDSSLEAA